MNIIQVLGWYAPDSVGGTEIYVATLAQSLQRAGHTVMVAAPDSQHDTAHVYEHQGVKVFRYPIPSHPTRDECQGIVPIRGSGHFHNWMREQNPDVVHFHTFVTGVGLPEMRAAKAAGARVFVTTHSPMLGYLCQRGTMMRWGRSLCDGLAVPAKCAACELQHLGLPMALARIAGSIPAAASRLAGRSQSRAGTALGMRDLIRRNVDRQAEVFQITDGFFALTDWAANVLKMNGAAPAKVIVNRLGIRENACTRKPSPDVLPTGRPVKLGYFGRFDEIKGVIPLAQAAASLPPEVEVRLEFRGPVRGATDRMVLDRLRAIVGNDPRVTFAEESSDAAAVLAGYDLLCCPSMALEGGPTVALEAMALGTPVLGSRIGGMAEFIVDGVSGRLLPPGDTRALAQALREIASDPAATIDCWRRGLPNHIRTMSEVAADYLALYTPRAQHGLAI